MAPARPPLTPLDEVWVDEGRVLARYAGTESFAVVGVLSVAEDLPLATRRLDIVASGTADHVPVRVQESAGVVPSAVRYRRGGTSSQVL